MPWKFPSSDEFWQKSKEENPGLELPSSGKLDGKAHNTIMPASGEHHENESRMCQGVIFRLDRETEKYLKKWYLRRGLNEIWESISKIQRKTCLSD